MCAAIQSRAELLIRAGRPEIERKQSTESCGIDPAGLIYTLLANHIRVKYSSIFFSTHKLRYIILQVTNCCCWERSSMKYNPNLGYYPDGAVHNYRYRRSVAYNGETVQASSETSMHTLRDTRTPVRAARMPAYCDNDSLSLSLPLIYLFTWSSLLYPRAVLHSLSIACIYPVHRCSHLLAESRWDWVYCSVVIIARARRIIIKASLCLGFLWQYIWARVWRIWIYRRNVWN